MYPRNLKPLKTNSFFLLGPRGTGKSTWARKHFSSAYLFDLLDESLFQSLLRDPSLFRAEILASKAKKVIVDEIQRLPELLNEVHRLIEDKKIQFILTGSSARKLRKGGSNLLAGRARLLEMPPLTASELSSKFDIKKSLKFGHLPEAINSKDPKEYLKAYIGVYLKEEIQQEALVRNLAQFANFLEVATFSQASVLSVQSVARECGVDRKTAENYFTLLEDLLIGHRLPVFQKKAKRKLSSHPKFYYFDVGVYKTLRRVGPLDSEAEVTGVALESLVFQEIKATLSNENMDCQLHYWKTQSKLEVNFVLYGSKVLTAIEVKSSERVRPEDTKGLRAFMDDYPQARALVFYGGKKKLHVDGIDYIPVTEALKNLKRYIEK